MIFFDQGSYVIPQQYQTFVGSADADRYAIGDKPEAVSTAATRREIEPELLKYYEVLNIIGARMDSLRSSRIELEGGILRSRVRTKPLASIVLML